MWPEPSGDYDLWLPVLVLLSFVLIRVLGGLRFGVRSAVAALVLGTLWSWSTEPLGVLPATALAVLLAFVAGGIVRRISYRRRA
jgi:hypothetical protein